MKSRPLAVAATAALLPFGMAALGTTAAHASPAPATAAPRTSLSQSMSPAVGRSHAQGTVSADRRMSVAVSLKLRNAAELDRLIAAVSTPGSPQYGHYLTAAQFAARYAPTRADVARALAYLRAQGLTVSGVSGNRQVIDAKGSVAEVNRAFGVKETNYLDTAEHRHFYANDKPASLPADIAGIVQGVSGLDNHTVRHHNLTRPEAVPKATPKATPSGLTPSQFNAAYRFNKLSADGTGQKVALWEFDGYKSSNLTTYDSQFSLSGPTVSTVSVDSANYDSSPGDGQGEVELDSEIVRGVAPKATQLVYEAPNSDQGELDMAAKIVSDNRVSVVSISWGSCEPDTTASSMTAVSNSFKQAAAQGISIFSASGDDGSRDCTRSTSGSGVKAVDFPASSPYNTGVGGTNLTLSSGAYGSEKAWSTSGGGISTVFSKPSWQTGSATMRTVPDVASNADPASGFAIYSAGSWQVYGGTSAAAPLWAGYAALYNQKAKAAGNAVLGEANPAIYKVATGSGYSSAFHDITSGANQDNSTTTGYDRVTGWGSPIADGLTSALLGGSTGGGTGGGTGGTCTAGQLLGNPGFETGTASPWTGTSGVVDNSSSEAAHAGSWKAWLDGYGSTHTDNIAQSVSIASGCKATFTFYLHTDTAETTTSTAYDKLQVQVLDSSGSVLGTLATYSNLNAASGYTQKSFDLSSYAGKTVTLKFTGTEDSSAQTSFVIDDTALNVS